MAFAQGCPARAPVAPRGSSAGCRSADGATLHACGALLRSVSAPRLLSLAGTFHGPAAISGTRARAGAWRGRGRLVCMLAGEAGGEPSPAAPEVLAKGEDVPTPPPEGAIAKGSAEGDAVARALHKHALDLSRSGRREDAIEALLGGAERFPGNKYILTTLGGLLYAAGRVEEARETFQRAADLEPARSAPTLCAWAVKEAQAGHRRKARNLFRDATEAEAHHAPAWHAWARFEEAHGRPPRARSLYQRALQADPGHVRSVQAWALLEAGMGSHNKARKLFGRATAEAPEHGPSWQAWAVMEHRLGRYGRARELFERGHGCTRTPHAPLLTAWGTMEAEVGTPSRARELFDAALEADPRHTHTYLAWGQLELKEGSFARAREFLEEGLRAQPRNGRLLHALAMVEKAVGDRPVAETLLQRVIDGNVGSVHAWHSLGVLATEAG
eukprot:CAMPEP_0182881908 /NCGR_PEP_ID=MMETSP0034_2-20130328/17455_1 /TAXON_ID=156128 /ORGANISM="Nephroselmis pyriformis, Strain CCMP717" /LENGTH=442 /DNA_ID=CAMNT_0025014957 /DNA_START=53 /DNA_END=1378 /DNA_ORIENTATION=-